MCVFVWHPEPCCIYLTYSCKIITISRLIFLCLLHSRTEFVCTKVVCKVLIKPYQFSNQLGFLVNLLLKVMTAAVNVTSIGFQFFLDLRILWTLKSFLALVFAEANLLVVSDFPEHKGDLRFEKPMGVEIPSIFKPSILDAGVIHFTLVVTTSCKFSERERLSTCKLYSDFVQQDTVPRKIFSGFFSFQECQLPINHFHFFPYSNLRTFSSNLNNFLQLQCIFIHAELSIVHNQRYNQQAHRV